MKTLNVQPQETTVSIELPSERHARVLCMLPRWLVGCNWVCVTHGSIMHTVKLHQRDVMLLNQRSS